MIAYKADNNKKAILKLKKDLMQKNNYNSRKFNKRGTYSTIHQKVVIQLIFQQKVQILKALPN